MNGDDLLNIGAFAAATGLTVPALRHYDEIGLLKPAQVDSGTGYRRYGLRQLGDARLICGLRAVGVPIDEVRAVLGQPRTQVRSALDAHRERLVAQVRELSQRIVAVDEFIEKGSRRRSWPRARRRRRRGSSPCRIRLEAPNVRCS